MLVIATYLTLKISCELYESGLRGTLACVVSGPHTTLSASACSVCQRNNFKCRTGISYPWLNAKLATASQLVGSTYDQWSIAGGANVGRRTLGRVGDIRSSRPCRNWMSLIGPTECRIPDRVSKPSRKMSHRSVMNEMCCPVPRLDGAPLAGDSWHNALHSHLVNLLGRRVRVL